MRRHVIDKRRSYVRDPWHPADHNAEIARLKWLKWVYRAPDVLTTPKSARYGWSIRDRFTR